MKICAFRAAIGKFGKSGKVVWVLLMILLFVILTETALDVGRGFFVMRVATDKISITS